MHCRCGARHWGRYGAAGLLLIQARPTRVLLQLRAGWTHQGGSWSTPGGAINRHETPVAAALREAEEECGVPTDAVDVLTTVLSADHGDWRYHLVLARLTRAVHPHSANEESDQVAWVRTDKVTTLPLHDGFAAGWQAAHRAVHLLVGDPRPDRS